MAESNPQKVSNYSMLLIHTDPDESQDDSTRIDELQRQTELPGESKKVYTFNVP